MDPRALMRPDLLSLEPYPPPPPIAEIERRLGRPVVKLDANENPYGASPRVGAALSRLDAAHYPDPDSTELRTALGRYLDVDPARIVCSTGGDEMLDLLLRLFLAPGDAIVDNSPSFVMYGLSAAYNRGTVQKVPRLVDFSVDVEGIERVLGPRTRVIFLCSPNNPTGNPTPVEDIERVLHMGRMVVLDEAYAEFAGYTLVHLTERFPNLVVLRTMSKWAALAGIRLGYAIADPIVVEEMKKIKSPYNVGIAAQVAGVASLEDREYLMSNVRKLVDERDRLRARLNALARGTIPPSETNFLYWPVVGVPVPALKTALARRGVFVRSFQEPVDALRISVGTPHESDVLMGCLNEAFEELERSP